MIPQTHTLGHILSLCTILLWGTTFISTKVLLRDFSPIEILFFRFILGYLALLAACPRLLHTQGDRRERIRQELCFAGAGLCGVTLYFLMENIALQYTFASNVGVIVSISPFLTALLAHFFLKKERLTRRFLFGFAVAISGIILISLNGNFVLRLNPLGDILAALAALVWAFYSILMVKIGQFHYPNLLCTRRIFLWGLIFMIPALFVFDVRVELERFSQMTNLLNILYLGLGASALCFASWNWAVKILGAVKTSVYIYMVPVVTIISAAIILKEQLTFISIIGTLLTLTGLFLSENRSKA